MYLFFIDGTLQDANIRKRTVIFIVIKAKADNKFIGNDKAVIIRHHFHKAPFLFIKHGRKANTLAVTGSEKFTDGF